MGPSINSFTSYYIVSLLIALVLIAIGLWIAYLLMKAAAYHGTKRALEETLRTGVHQGVSMALRERDTPPNSPAPLNRAQRQAREERGQ